MLGLVTDSHRRDLVPDDRLLVAALQRRGVEPQIVVWDETPVAQLPERLLLRTPWDYIDRIAEFLPWTDAVEASGRSLWNPAATVRWNHDKQYLVELGERGIPVVPTTTAVSEAQLEAAVDRILARRESDRIVVKPAVSASAKGVVVVPAERATVLAAGRQTLAQGRAVFQPFVPSVAEEGELSLIFTRLGDVEFSHAVAKRPKSGDFRVQSDHGGVYHREMPSEALLALSRQVLAALPIDWCYARVDWLQWKTNPWLGEVEVIEPHLYWHHAPEKADRFAERLLAAWTLKTKEPVPCRGAELR